MSKRYYKARMLKKFRLVILILLIFFLVVLYKSTFNDPTFLSMNDTNMMTVLRFHWRYPQELLTFILVVLIPAIYFAFIRGTSFYQDYIKINHGIPFVNSKLDYNDIESYKILHPKHLLAIETKNDKNFLITTNDIDRIISILDKQGIKGHLNDEEYALAKRSQRKVFVYLLLFVLCMTIMQELGVFRWIYRG